MPGAAEVVLVAVRAGDQEVEHEREAEREDGEAAVAERAQQLEAGVGESRACIRTAAASLAGQLEERLLEAGAAISMSRAAG